MTTALTAGAPTSVTGPPTLTVALHLDAADVDAALRADVLTGLRAKPKWLAPKWFYDDLGSQLFDDITRLPEYYPSRRETAILRSRVAVIAARTGAETLIELGSGTSTKTTLLLDALTATGSLRRFVPFDVSEATLLGAGANIARRYPDIDVHALVGDFERHLGALPAGDRRLIAFLGGTIGNLTPPQRARFFAEMAVGMGRTDALLLGTDLVKEPARLVAAYDDAAGVTAAFNRNVLAVLNRELGADFAPDRFEHVAVWDEAQEWIEMRLRATVAHRVSIDALDLVVEFAAGEQLRTEISAKFRRRGLATELAAAGLELAQWWTDDDGDFALSLVTRRREPD